MKVKISTELFEIISIYWTKQNMVTIDTVLFLHLFCICISKLKTITHQNTHTCKQSTFLETKSG